MLSPHWRNVTQLGGCKAGHHYQVQEQAQAV